MSNPLTAHELVNEVSTLAQVDPDLLAKIANVPVKNLYTWLAGKQKNLLATSVRQVMTAIGIEIGAEGAYLAPNRVHYWHLNDCGFGGRKGEAYRGLTRISRLLSECQITEICLVGTRPPKKGMRYFMLTKLTGRPVRVLLSVDVGVFRVPRITPDYVRGSMWRDSSEEHIVYVQDPVFWARVVTRDLTPHEFDWIFTESYDPTTWADVGLMARETGVRASELMSYMHQRAAERHGSRKEQSSEDAGVVELQDRIMYLVAG